MTTLLYSFEPFAELKTNPAAEIVKQITQRNAQYTSVILPVTFSCGDKLSKEIEDINPDCIIGFGVAAGIPCVQLECYALNEMAARIPDNNGRQPENEVIIPNAPCAYRTTYPVSTLQQKLKEKEIPVRLSYHAGLYVCNYSYYWAMHLASQRNIPALFIHVPLSTQEAAISKRMMASLPTSYLVEALQSVL